ncbi:MAG: GGDEF domain-containing protein [Pseudomonadota bacterium]
MTKPLLDNKLIFNLRPLAVLIGLGVFSAFCHRLLSQNLVGLEPNLYLAILSVWSMGLVVLIVWPTWIASRENKRFDDDTVVMWRAMWCNTGAVCLAMSIPETIRFLLLVIPVFGVFYAALHLSQRNVFVVVGGTWVVYVLCLVFMVGSYIQPGEAAAYQSSNFEALSFTAFTVMLVSAALVSGEVLRVRGSLAEQNKTLERLMDQSRELASRDELTGVHNRRYMLEILERQKELADRDQQKFTVCFCDLDHFKQINDRYGHASGDKALREFADLAKATVRRIDYVARLGGEEFLLVLVGVDESIARGVADRLVQRTRRLVPEGFIPEGSGPTGVVSNSTTGIESKGLSVSIGVTTYRSRESIDELLRRADGALYSAKQKGRDQVVVVHIDAA